MNSDSHDPDDTIADDVGVSDSGPYGLPEGSDLATPIQDEIGEDTMDSVEVGSLGSGPINFAETASAAVPTRRWDDIPGDEAAPPASVSTRRWDEMDDSGAEPLEAELVEDSSESGDATMAMGDETLAELSAKVGNRQLGDFELERKIGQGGMGEVWLARQISLDRPVAVKVLPRTLATQENFIERFQREAKAAASLVHPNVIQIYAYGIDEGTPYFAMEYVEGEDLQQRMRRINQLDWGEIVDIMVGVGSALQVAHEKGLIHRDIKPSNIMIDKNGIVKVMDFGLAKATSGAETQSLTNAGLIMGTPNYLSPEQGRGDPLDGRSDMYSLGIVLYELLTGTLPFRADTPAGLIFKHVYEPPPPPDEIREGIPPFLVEITLKLLEKDPDDRYTNPQEFLADLAEFIDNFDYYVAEAGERRPESGYLDPERMAGFASQSISGPIRKKKKRSSSDRRNAVTEEVTKGVIAPQPDPVVAEERRPPTPLPEEPVDAEPRAPTKSRPRPYRPEPVKRSKAPLVFFLLLVGVGGGLGYLYQYDRETFTKYGVKFGLITPSSNGPGKTTPGKTTPGKTTPGKTSGTTGPGPKAGEVAFTFATEGWPQGVTIELKRPDHTYKLERGAADRYPLSDDYKLHFARRGYEPQSFAVRLVASPTDAKKGRLLDKDGREAGVPKDWKPTDTLSGAYKRGRDAFLEGDLVKAREELEAAARLDPQFESLGGGTVEALLAKVKKKEKELTKVGDRLKDQLDLIQGEIKKRHWRSALKSLLRLPKASRTREWNGLIDRCQTKTELGDRTVKEIEEAIKRGDHADGRKRLKSLGEVDPENPQLAAGGIEKRLRAAATARSKAFQGGDPTAQKTRLDDYLSEYGPNDVEAKQLLKQVSQRLDAAMALSRQLEELDRLERSKSWKLLRQRANEVLAKHPNNRKAQEKRSKAEAELARSDIQGVIASLDHALVKGDLDRAARLFDPSSSAYKKERQALKRLREVQGRFTSSLHKHIKIQMEGEFALVSAEWSFTLSVLGGPVTEMTTQHKIQLRLVEKRWLLTELKVQGGIRRVQ